MADIRRDQTVKDNFNRANENPLSGGGNWALPDTRWTNMALISNAITETGTVSESYWTPETYDGDNAEVWARAEGGGSGAEGVAWSMGLWYAPDVGGSNAISGYRMRLEGAGTIDFVLRRYDDNSATVLQTASGAPSSDPGLLLFRRNGNDVEGWWADSAGTDPSSWTQVLGVTDTTYMTNFYLGLGCAENSVSQNLGWDDFGGGSPPNRPQIYRWIRTPE